jgi:hypothetical protein
VASRGTIVQQGYVTNEVIQYQSELPQWKKPVKYQLVAGSGYPVYSETFAVRPDRKAALAPCLRKLVPAMQRATVAFAANPEPTNRLISQLVTEYKSTNPYPAERAAKAVQAMKAEKLLGNGPDATVGNFDQARVAKLLQIVGPIFSTQKTPLRAGLEPSDLATNEFIDPAIGLPG